MGRQIGYVKLVVGSRAENLVDVPVGSGRATVADRAASIKARMNALRTTDPLWWTRLTVAQKNHEWVVATPAAPGGYIITADAQFAHLRNRTPQQLAQDLVASIRATYDPAPMTLTARDLDMDQIHREAVQAWEQGNEAYDKNDMAGAEADYLKAIALEPNYVAAYETLGGLYAGQKRADEAREQFQKALSCSGIHAEQKAEIQQALNRLQ
jgi:tetratricopeptide (TPR) repeat protein